MVRESAEVSQKSHRWKLDAPSARAVDYTRITGNSHVTRLGKGFRHYRPSLPVLMASRMMDVLWSELHISHQSKSSKSGDSFYRPLRTA
jgi:hypothetical protein